MGEVRILTQRQLFKTAPKPSVFSIHLRKLGAGTPWMQKRKRTTKMVFSPLFSCDYTPESPYGISILITWLKKCKNSRCLLYHHLPRDICSGVHTKLLERTCAITRSFEQPVPRERDAKCKLFWQQSVSQQGVPFHPVVRTVKGNEKYKMNWRLPHSLSISAVEELLVLGQTWPESWNGSFSRPRHMRQLPA